MSAHINLRTVFDTDEAMVHSEAPGGERPAGVFIICLLALYLVIITGVIIYSLLAFAPVHQADSLPVRYFSFFLNIDEHTRMFALVGLSGALGGQLHALRSFSTQVGSGALYGGWLRKYLTLPLVGASLGLIGYIALRATLFSAQTDNNEINPLGFAAMGAIAGLFSEPLLEKLKQAADTLVAEPSESKDEPVPAHLPESSPYSLVNLDAQRNPSSFTPGALTIMAAPLSPRALVHPSDMPPIPIRDNPAFSGVLAPFGSTKQSYNFPQLDILPAENSQLPVIEIQARKREPDEQ